MGIPLDKAMLLALLLENIMYGIFITLYILLLVISINEKGSSITNQRFILPVATVMMVLATTHLILEFVRANQAFTTGTETRLPNPLAYYPPVNNPLHITKQSIYAFQTLIGDCVIVWRCYVIFNKRWYILAPAGLTLLANLASIGVIIWLFSIAAPGRNVFQTADHWITAFYIFTMSVNVCCTGAMAGKIWNTRRHAASASRSLFPVIAVIIESGALYSASVMVLLVTYLTASNGQYATLDLVTPLVGVTYCLIVLQIHYHVRVSPSASGRGATSNWSIPTSWRRKAPHDETTILGSDYKSYPLQSGVAVHITEHAETHTDQDFRSKVTRFDNTGTEA